MSEADQPVTDNLETIRRQNEIAVRKVREFIEKFREIQEYERWISEKQRLESKVPGPYVNA